MAAEPTYRWTCVTTQAPFAARDGAGALTFKGRMWLLGGWNPGDKEHFPKTCNSEVWSSADGREWKLEALNAPWEGRHTAGYVVHRGRMWIVGGDCIQKHYQNDVWSSADGVNWEMVTDAVPWGPRVLHYTVAFKDRIYVMGGQTLPQFAPVASTRIGAGLSSGPGRCGDRPLHDDDIFYRDVWSSSDGKHWDRVIEEAAWPQRGMIGGSVVMNDRIWVLGGGTYDTPQRPNRLFFNDVWSSVDGHYWEQRLEHAPWHPRQYHDTAVFDGRMWVLEGWNQSNRNDVWYSSDGIIWHKVPNTPWPPRHAASVFVHNNALWMVAGNNMTPDVWKLTGTQAR